MIPFCNTFDLIQVMIGLENQFFGLFESGHFTQVLMYEPAHKISVFGPLGEKTCLQGFANNTGTDQPAHLPSLISTFVIRFLESTICKLATGEISIV